MFSVINYELKILTMTNVVESTGVDMHAHDAAMMKLMTKCVGYGLRWPFPVAG